jgi:hypothetical protein
MPRATFRAAGGSIYLFSHPFLAGAVSGSTSVNEIDVSRNLKLNDTYFSAQPAQDSAFQETLVDGSTITITNHLMNGVATLQALPGDGTVSGGDLIAAAHFIIASKDDAGGILKRIRFINGKALTRVYYGVSFKNVPHDIDAGNAVPTYPIVMLYGGWIDGIKAGNDAEKVLWAVGSKYGLKGNFKPFTVNGASVATGEGGDFFNSDPARYTEIDDGSADNESVVPDSFDPRPDGLDEGYSRVGG